jgi:hypothetical protein
MPNIHCQIILSNDDDCSYCTLLILFIVHATVGDCRLKLLSAVETF